MLWWELLLLVGLGATFFAAVVNEADGFAALPFCLGLAYCQWKLDLWGWVLANYRLFLVYVIFYFIAGAVWSLFKWYRFVKAELERCKGIKNKSDKYDWAFQLTLNNWPPCPDQNKSKIVRWIVAWPVNLVWAILEDFFVWVGRKIYSFIGDIYRKIANKLFAEVLNGEN